VAIPPRHDPDFIFDAQAVQDQADFFVKKLLVMTFLKWL
jgi:hypothetical protein